MRSTEPLAALAVAVTAVVTMSGCQDDPLPEPTALDLAQQPIVGGSRAATCQWPTAVGLDQSCTGTLVHPRVVTTAGHCLTEDGPKEITFGEVWSGQGVVRTVKIERCHDGQDSGIEGDFGFCVLAEAVTDVPVVPVLMGCETAALQSGQAAVLTGYGRRGGISFRSGVKYLVDVAINQVVGNDVHLGNSRAGGCHGDSGGPAFVQLGDGSWRTFGATSRGTLFCNGQTIYTLIHPFVPWMEATSGIDITPCHDGDGAWNPGAECNGFPRDPQAEGKTWANMCSDVLRGQPSATCGPPRAE